jgi:hypothetical protein
MSKGFLLGVVLVLLAACSTQRKICPAYQSAFIFDQDALRKKFSYFENDSTPKVYTASRNNYLLIPEESYRKKIKSLQTIEMKPVYTVLPDSNSNKKGKGEGDFYKAPENIDSLLRTQTRDLEAPPEQPKAPVDTATIKKDSVEVDSSYQITKDKEVRFYRYHWDTLRRRADNLRNKRGEELSAMYKKYAKSNDSAKYRVDNIRLGAEEEMYLWYLRDVLVLPDVRAAIEDEKRANDTTKKAKEEPDTVKKVGFFKSLLGLFKKKLKQDSISTPDSVVREKDDFADEELPDVSDSTVTKPKPKKEKKKKVKKTEKKKDDIKQTPVKEKKKEPAKKEDEDDGF